MASIFRYLIGNPKKDFAPKIIPDLLRDAKRQAERSEQPSAEARPSRAEFAKRYRNLQIGIYLVWAVALFAGYQAVTADSFVTGLAAILAVVVMIIHSLSMLFRASVARGMWVTWGQNRYPEKVHIGNFMAVVLRKPSELLPLPLPKVQERPAHPDRRIEEKLK